MLDWSVTSGLSLSTSVANTSVIIFKDLESFWKSLVVVLSLVKQPNKT
jgi:hypothetical protein